MTAMGRRLPAHLVFTRGMGLSRLLARRGGKRRPDIESTQSASQHTEGSGRSKTGPTHSPSKLPFRLSQRSASSHQAQTDATCRQKRAEWFISRRCISSW